MDKPEPENQSPFHRVESQREKWLSLITNATFSSGMIIMVVWMFDADLRQPIAWLIGYGGLFFGMNALHSWRSIRYGWNIEESNKDFYSPMFSWTTSKWLFLALTLGWYAAKKWL